MKKIFTIIFQAKDYEVIEVLPSVAGDEKYLIQDDDRFYNLSELSNSEYIILNSESVPDLIAELEVLSNQLETTESLEHIERIKELAKKCRDLKGSYLIITPFDFK